MSSLPQVLIAEDETLVSMVLEDMLQELGYEVACASNLESALLLAEDSAYVAAILDYHLHGLKVDPVAELLSARGIPYAIASGMDREDMQLASANVPHLPKPYIMDDVSRVLSRLLKIEVDPPAAEYERQSA